MFSKLCFNLCFGTRNFRLSFCIEGNNSYISFTIAEVNRKNIYINSCKQQGKVKVKCVCKIMPISLFRLINRLGALPLVAFLFREINLASESHISNSSKSRIKLDGHDYSNYASGEKEKNYENQKNSY